MNLNDTPKPGTGNQAGGMHKHSPEALLICGVLGGGYTAPWAARSWWANESMNRQSKHAGQSCKAVTDRHPSHAGRSCLNVNHSCTDWLVRFEVGGPTSRTGTLL
jgi:hypothetical protein